MIKLALFYVLALSILPGAPLPSNKHNFGTRAKSVDSSENNADFWHTQAQGRLQEKLKLAEKKQIAKNVILFMGDGMSIPTLAAARIAMGNENTVLSFETFPHTAVSKTYCVNSQVADSACSATAYLGGVKANIGTIGVTGAVVEGDCDAMTDPSTLVPSIAVWSQARSKRTGFVTTTRVTHASPAGVYAHTANRLWESDADVLLDGHDPLKCPDIARQLIDNPQLNVIMGGGMVSLKPEKDGGYRKDGADLVAEWLAKHATNATYVTRRENLLGIEVSNVDYLLGVFSDDHMTYNLDKTVDSSEPSLAEMTAMAIKVLDKGPEGYFLFVEGGRIDTAHHENAAHKAIDETIEFARAIELAMNVTNEEDTLIVVTSDHAHTMSLSGYPVRGTDIFGRGGDDVYNKDDDGNQFLSINYANGPGNKDVYIDATPEMLQSKDFAYPAVFPLASSTHGGDDTLIFARGPWAHLFRGVMEENVIPHIMAYASCVGDGVTACSGAFGANVTHLTSLFAIVTILLNYINFLHC